MSWNVVILKVLAKVIEPVGKKSLRSAALYSNGASVKPF